MARPRATGTTLTGVEDLTKRELEAMAAANKKNSEAAMELLSRGMAGLGSPSASPAVKGAAALAPAASAEKKK